MKLHYSLLLALLLLTTSCGFHLRGSQPGKATAISSIAISDISAAGVGTEVKALLRAYGTSITASVDDAEFGLQLADQLLNKTVLSVSAIDGKVEEYQLTLTVRMTVTRADKTELLTGQQIRVTRDYAFDDDAVLGSVSEQRLLEQEMTRQAASQIIRRLSALTRQ
jgi:LPS-assembly lipoprotein